jgi:hypothetical protein
MGNAGSGGSFIAVMAALRYLTPACTGRVPRVVAGRGGRLVLEFAPVGPVAQLVRAGDSSLMVPSHRKVRSGRDEFRETLTAWLMATLSQAGGTPPEGAETT